MISVIIPLQQKKKYLLEPGEKQNATVQPAGLLQQDSKQAFICLFFGGKDK